MKKNGALEIELNQLLERIKQEYCSAEVSIKLEYLDISGGPAAESLSYNLCKWPKSVQ